MRNEQAVQRHSLLKISLNYKQRSIIHCSLLIAHSAILLLFLCSCEIKPKAVEFQVWGTEEVLYGLNREAVEGWFEFSKPKKLEYRFAAAVMHDPRSNPLSFELEYSFSGKPPDRVHDQRLVLSIENYSWVLPISFDGDILHYAVPFGQVTEGFLPDAFAVFLTGNGERDSSFRFQIHSVEITRRWYGFFRRDDELGDHLYISPFVTRKPGEAAADGISATGILIDSASTDSTLQENISWVIDPPATFSVPAGFFPVLSVELQPGKEAHISTGGYLFSAFPQLNRITIPACFNSGSEPVIFTGDRLSSFYYTYETDTLPFPEPIPADPGMIFLWPLNTWRDSRYEIFRWEQFPSLLIFDFANYRIQDKMLKRLAFFVEKTGFRGRLAPDSEIAELHGWNAHDYRAEDLASFFQMSRDTNFPLLAEERELERILLAQGIIKETGSGLQGGKGGIISISRESPDYLRYRFMAHEGCHGLFFIDEDFRTFSMQRWLQFNAVAKRFLLSYFGYQQYDIKDEYLLINEFMAHILQQPVSQAGAYFGQTLPSRLENTWRRADLPAKDEASGTWKTLATAFTREAQAFSGYIGERWGLAAGRVHLINVKKR